MNAAEATALLNAPEALAAREARRRPGDARVRRVEVLREYRADGECVRGLCRAVHVLGTLMLCLPCAVREAT